MKRLDFKLPEFVRFAWVNIKAQEVWEPRIHRIRKIWQQIELKSVSAGIRPCALQFVKPDALVDFSKEVVNSRLSLLPLELQGKSRSLYVSHAVPYEKGQEFEYATVTGSQSSINSFKTAWDKKDNCSVGRFLGYPECCSRAFEEIWTNEGFMDTTWSMAKNRVPTRNNSSVIDFWGPFQTNIMLRYLGVRAIPHLPCSVRCIESVELANKLLQLGRDLGYHEEIDWLEKMLSWPIEWSVLHGIAEIKSPVIKIVATTDATAFKYIVRRHSNSYPIEGARGISFPYKQT